MLLCRILHFPVAKFWNLFCRILEKALAKNRYCKEDGFKKKKNLGRVEQVDATTGKSRWVEIEKEWIELYRNRRAVDGFSATHKVNGDDEWLCEAYMKTDYTKLTEQDFQQTINDYLAYLVKEGHIYES